MKKIIFFLFTATSFVACKKDNNDTEIIPVNNAPKYKTVTFGSKTTTYNYDQYGRQVMAAVNDGSKTETSYSKGFAIQKIFNTSGVLDKTGTFELNADGLLKKVSYSNNPADYTLYEYGPGNLPSKTSSKIGADTYYNTYHYTAGTLDSICYFMNNTRTLTNVFTYYADQNSTMTPANSGTQYYSLTSKFMMKSLTHQQVNGTISPENYSYEYDASGRLVKLTEVSNNGTSIGYYTYY